MTGAPRITEIHIQGLRTLADVRLKLDGLTVLIGENGSGKSSIIEACELLRRAGGSEFMSEFFNPHGGPFALFRDGASAMELGIELVGGFEDRAETSISYRVRLGPRGVGAVVEAERLEVKAAGEAGTELVIVRGPQNAMYHGSMGLERVAVPAEQLVRAVIGPGKNTHPAVRAVRDALRSIDVQLPFEVLPAWAARAYSRKSEIRSSVLLAPAERLDLLGTNLANVYYALREQSDRAYWDDTMDLIRLGLGIEFEEVRSAVDMGGGAHTLAVKWRGRDRLMLASALSDGQIAFLAFVALYRLKRERALLAIDEPELHLHPGLIVRALQMLEALGEHHPVLVATHSDRLLDALSNPVSSVRVCETVGGGTRIRQLDAKALAAWLADYAGVGALRSEGHLIDVMEDSP